MYAGDWSCARLAMEAAPVFIAETLDREALERLPAEGIGAVLCQGRSIWTVGPPPAVTGLYDGFTLNSGENLNLVFTNEYQEGDSIVLDCDYPCFCVVQFEDSLPPALVYAAGRELWYHIPFGADRIVFSPKCFTGGRHLIRARLAEPHETAARRNLAFNPYDQHGDNGFFPHSKANVETRGESVFGAAGCPPGGLPPRQLLDQRQGHLLRRQRRDAVPGQDRAAPVLPHPAPDGGMAEAGRADPGGGPVSLPGAEPV